MFLYDTLDSFLERLMIVFRRERDGAAFFAKKLVSNGLVRVQADGDSHAESAEHGCDQTSGGRAVHKVEVMAR